MNALNQTAAAFQFSIRRKELTNSGTGQFGKSKK